MKPLTREGRSMLAKMKAAGKKWAEEYLESDHWNDFLWESISYLRKNPDDVPADKKGWLRAAKNVLIDVTHNLPDGRDLLRLPAVRSLVGSADMADYHLSKEGVDYGEFMSAFRNAAHEKLLRMNVIAWAADELRFQVTEK